MRVGVCLDAPPVVSAMGIPRHGEARPSDDYLLPEHWCFHIYGYHATLELDGIPHVIHPSYASLVPPGVRMVYHYTGPSDHVYFHFKIGAGSISAEAPMVLDLGDRYASMDNRARRAAGAISGSPAHGVATLWSLLWELIDLDSERADSQQGNSHPLVDMAIRHIEQRLSSPISVAGLSSEVGVSDGYLTRLFRRCLGMPVSEYIRQRRADQAEHLLKSTTLPIKVVARTVGVPNLQLFNRLMHERKRACPRQIRLGHDDHADRQSPQPNRRSPT